MTMNEIEKRIEMIEKWQAGYESKSEAALFGDDYPIYTDILQKMDSLCQEAEALTLRTRTKYKNQSGSST